MVKDAESHAEDDRRRKEEAEVRNTADTLVYQTDKLLAEQGEKIDAGEKADVEAALVEVKTALAGTDIESIKTATEKLMSASQSFSQKLYEAASAAQNDGAAGAGSAADANDDEVVDAEIVDEK